jgi:HEAT repeat protein
VLAHCPVLAHWRRGARAQSREEALDHLSTIPKLPQPSAYDAASGLLLRRAPGAPPPGAASEDASAGAVAAAIATRDLRAQLPAQWEGDGVGAVATLLERFYPSAQVRVGALRVVSDIGRHAGPALGAVVACLGDPAPTVRAEAAHTLASLRCSWPESSDALAAAVAPLVGVEARATRLAAIEALPCFEDDATAHMDTLRWCLEHDADDDIRVAAARSLARIGDAHAADWLEWRDGAAELVALQREEAKRLGTMKGRRRAARRP